MENAQEHLIINVCAKKDSKDLIVQKKFAILNVD
jgi:hypothetical protein